MSFEAVDTSERQENGRGLTGQRSPTAKMKRLAGGSVPAGGPRPGSLPKAADSPLSDLIDRHTVAVLRIIKFW